MADLTPWYITSLIRESKMVVDKGLHEITDEVLDQVHKAAKDVIREVLDEKQWRKAKR